MWEFYVKESLKLKVVLKPISQVWIFEYFPTAFEFLKLFLSGLSSNSNQMTVSQKEPYQTVAKIGINNHVENGLLLIDAPIFPQKLNFVAKIFFRIDAISHIMQLREPCEKSTILLKCMNFSMKMSVNARTPVYRWFSGQFWRD
jgi:hypothetical protein